MNKVDMRKKELLRMLQTSETLTVSDAAQHLGVSLPTARRLCSQLSQEGKATRIHGGLRYLEHPESAYSFDLLSNEHVEEKTRIAKYASSLIQSNQVIFIEAGTTLRHFSIALAERLRKQELSNLVIFTNSLINLNILYPIQTSIMMIGGQYRDERKDFIGYLSEMALKGLQFNYCFIGADAISPSGGVMAMDIDTVRFDAELVKHSEKVIILAHSEKFKKRSLISYVSVDNVDSIITDNGLDLDTINEYRQHNVRIFAV
ncbi:MAG: DeoR/GlpR family DNA-binding transcription regulator [Oscillospiraceae bacterium]